MLRGNDRKNILIDKEDKERFIQIVYQKKTGEMFRLYAYYFEMKEPLELGISEQNINEYIERYLKSRSLKKKDLKKREHIIQRDIIINQLIKRLNLSKRRVAILEGVNRETVRKVSKEPFL